MENTDFIIKKRKFECHDTLYQFMLWYPQDGYHNGGWGMWKWDARLCYWRYINGQAPCTCNPRGQLAAALRQLRQASS